MSATIAQVRTYADKDSVEHLPFASRTAGRQSKLRLFTQSLGHRSPLPVWERNRVKKHPVRLGLFPFIENYGSRAVYQRRVRNRATASLRRSVSTVKLKRI